MHSRTSKLAVVLGLVLSLAAAASSPAQECVGDANGDGMVSISELVQAVNNALNGCPNPPALCNGDGNGDGNVTINELVLAVNNALSDCTGIVPTAVPTATPDQVDTPTATPVGNGARRVFTLDGTVDPTDGDESPTGTWPDVTGTNSALGVVAEPLIFEMGDIGPDGIASLRLVEDAVVGLQVIAGFVSCTRMIAAESTGFIDCDGGTAVDLQFTQFGLETGLGEDAGPGAAQISLRMEIATFEPGDGVAVEECGDVELDDFGVQTMATGMAFAQSVAGSIARNGENFNCDSFTQTDGPGRFVLPIVDEFPFVGESGAVVRYADTPVGQ